MAPLVGANPTEVVAMNALNTFDNADGVFDSADMVTAFTDGGYEKGPRTDAVAVPEPGGWLGMAAACMLLAFRRRRVRCERNSACFNHMSIG